MEQGCLLYQFAMKGEEFRFEAQNDVEAEMSQKYALLHFKDVLGSHFSEKDLLGPMCVETREIHHAPGCGNG